MFSGGLIVGGGIFLQAIRPGRSASSDSRQFHRPRIAADERSSDSGRFDPQHGGKKRRRIKGKTAPEGKKNDEKKDGGDDTTDK